MKTPPGVVPEMRVLNGIRALSMGWVVSFPRADCCDTLQDCCDTVDLQDCCDTAEHLTIDSLCQTPPTAQHRAK